MNCVVLRFEKSESWQDWFSYGLGEVWTLPKSVRRHYSQIMLHPFKDHAERIFGLRCVVYMRITLVWFNNVIESPNVLTWCHGSELVIAIFAFPAYLRRAWPSFHHDTKLELAIITSNQELWIEPYKPCLTEELDNICALKTVAVFNISTTWYMHFRPLRICPIFRVISFEIPRRYVGIDRVPVPRVTSAAYSRFYYVDCV